PVRESNTTVVAIGASAGGIEALTDLMTYLSPDTGMAFVLVQHLDPKHHSILTELLARKTTMSVTEVSDGLPIKPNHVYVIPPKGIAKELARIARHPYVARNILPGAAEAAPDAGPGLNTIFHVLRRATGVDFTHYRQTTILRRIQRRMVVHKIDKLEDYAKFVQSKPSEVKALYQDMLINVTSFFRGP